MFCYRDYQLTTRSEECLEAEAGKLGELPKGTGDWLMTMKIPLSHGRKHIAIISGYTPSITNLEEVKYKFYEQLHSIISSVPKADKLIILDDFNTRLGSDNISLDGVTGKYGVGCCKSSCLLLLQTYAEHELLITNTIFSLPTNKSMLLIQPHLKQWQLINYVIVRKMDTLHIWVTRSMCSTKYWMKHYLIVSKVNIHIQCKRHPQSTKAPKWLNIAKLKNLNARLPFADT